MNLQKNSANATFGGWQQGVTLVELVVAIVIISIGLAGVAAVFSTTVRTSADPMIRKQMLAIAEEMMGEIAMVPYGAAATSGTTSCSRSTFQVTLDYHNYDCAILTAGLPPVAITELAAYRVQATVTTDTMNGKLPAGDGQKIVITVSGPGADSLKLVSWRSKWGDAL